MEPETQIQENKTQIQTREITEDDLKQIIENVLKEGREESKYILILEIRNRDVGCGYIYLYKEEIELIEGNVEMVELDDLYFNCEEVKKYAIIPKTLPVVLKLTHIDQNPTFNDYIEYHVFTIDGWKKIFVQIPK